MLQIHALKSFCGVPCQRQLKTLRNYRPHSSHCGTQNDEANAVDFAGARKWFSQFNKSTIPMKLAKTSFSRSSGPGGQKTNKTSSKATTVWPMSALADHVPKILLPGLRASSYYVSSSDSVSIQCDTHRRQSDNEQETHDRLAEEIQRIFNKRVPGVTSPEQKKKIEQLKMSENSARLKMKKKHGDKKRARSGGGDM